MPSQADAWAAALPRTGVSVFLAVPLGYDARSYFLFTSSVTLRCIGAAVSTAGSTDIRHPVSADGRLAGGTDA